MTSITTDRIGGNLVPEGVHPFKVIEFEERTGPSGDYWNFTCAITGNSPFEGQRCWVVISLSPQSRWKAEQWLDCFEIPEGMEIEGDDFVGLSFRGKVIHEQGKDGKTRAKIDEFLPSQKVALKKGVTAPAPKVGVKKAAAPVAEEDDDEDEQEEAAAEEDDDDEAEEVADDEDDDDEEEVEEVKPKKSAKAVAKPFPVQAGKGKLPKPQSKYKRPF